VNRVLTIQLRRFGLPGAVLVLLAGTAGLYSRTVAWSGGWISLAMSLREYLMLMCPAALAAGAWLARQEHRAKVAELFAGTPRPRHQRVMSTLAAVGLAVTGGYLGVLAVTAPWIAGTARYLPGAAVAVAAVGVLAVIAAAWIGLAVGRLLPNPATAPVLAVIGLLAIVAGPAAFRQEWQSALASPSWGMSPFSEFQTVPGRASAAQAILAAALAVAGAILLAAGRWRTRAVALVPVVLGLVLSVAVMPRDHDNIVFDPVAQQLVCTGDAPRVCVGRVHAGLLPEVTPHARQALTLLARLPDPPTAVQEDTNDYLDDDNPLPGPDTVVFRLEVGGDGHLADPDHLLPRLLQAAGADAAACPEGYDVPVARAVGAYLAGRPPARDPQESPLVREPGGPPVPDYDAEATVLWEGLRQLPEAEALARVAAVRKAALECTGMTGLLAGGTR
jgi:hypothetical protein